MMEASTLSVLKVDNTSSIESCENHDANQNSPSTAEPENLETEQLSGEVKNPVEEGGLEKERGIEVDSFGLDSEEKKQRSDVEKSEEKIERENKKGIEQTDNPTFNDKITKMELTHANPGVVETKKVPASKLDTTSYELDGSKIGTVPESINSYDSEPGMKEKESKYVETTDTTDDGTKTMNDLSENSETTPGQTITIIKEHMPNTPQENNSKMDTTIGQSKEIVVEGENTQQCVPQMASTSSKESAVPSPKGATKPVESQSKGSTIWYDDEADDTTGTTGYSTAIVGGVVVRTPISSSPKTAKKSAKQTKELSPSKLKLAWGSLFGKKKSPKKAPGQTSAPAQSTEKVEGQISRDTQEVKGKDQVDGETSGITVTQQGESEETIVKVKVDKVSVKEEEKCEGDQIGNLNAKTNISVEAESVKVVEEGVTATKIQKPGFENGKETSQEEISTALGESSKVNEPLEVKDKNESGLEQKVKPGVDIQDAPAETAVEVATTETSESVEPSDDVSKTTRPNLHNAQIDNVLEEAALPSDATPLGKEEISPYVQHKYVKSEGVIVTGETPPGKEEVASEELHAGDSSDQVSPSAEVTIQVSEASSPVSQEVSSNEEISKKDILSEPETIPDEDSVLRERILASRESGARSVSPPKPSKMHMRISYAESSKDGEKEVELLGTRDVAMRPKSTNKGPADHRISCMELKDVDYEGWLTKKGGGKVFAAWKRKWVVVKDQRLYYYKTSFDPEAGGMIHLDNCESTAAPEMKRKFCFKCESKTNKSHNTFFAADTEQDMRTWLDVLGKASRGEVINLPQHRKTEFLGVQMRKKTNSISRRAGSILGVGGAYDYDGTIEKHVGPKRRASYGSAPTQSKRISSSEEEKAAEEGFGDKAIEALTRDPKESDTNVSRASPDSHLQTVISEIREQNVELVESSPIEAGVDGETPAPDEKSTDVAPISEVADALQEKEENEPQIAPLSDVKDALTGKEGVSIPESTDASLKQKEQLAETATSTNSKVEVDIQEGSTKIIPLSEETVKSTVTQDSKEDSEPVTPDSEPAQPNVTVAGVSNGGDYVTLDIGVAVTAVDGSGIAKETDARAESVPDAEVKPDQDLIENKDQSQVNKDPLGTKEHKQELPSGEGPIGGSETPTKDSPKSTQPQSKADSPVPIGGKTKWYFTLDDEQGWVEPEPEVDAKRSSLKDDELLSMVRNIKAAHITITGEPVPEIEERMRAMTTASNENKELVKLNALKRSLKDKERDVEAMDELLSNKHPSHEVVREWMARHSHLSDELSVHSTGDDTNTVTNGEAANEDDPKPVTNGEKANDRHTDNYSSFHAESKDDKMLEKIAASQEVDTETQNDNNVESSSNVGNEGVQSVNGHLDDNKSLDTRL
ncbi:microtubule-associated protein futsch isoform X2 [Nematostella vectensis]|uniref:microtubule-associated protein futsch isoform X2 n=1 Tax=Nematostella vectensis TaxID=45351 RepID=UPI0020778A45|nr:microtubule-associated protein futsch isoform X2 [Nematostella vectensis]